MGPIRRPRIGWLDEVERAVAVTAVLDRVVEWRAARAVVPDTVLAFAVAFTVFFPIVAARLHGTLTPQILLLLLVWLNSVTRRRIFDMATLSAVALGIAYVGFGLVFSRLLVTLEGPLFATAYERLTVLLPLSAAIAWTLTRTGRWHIYLWAFLAGGLVSVPLAIAEYVFNVSLLRTNHQAFVRNDETRAVVGTEHPLVLGALLVALIPVAAYLLRYSRLRYLTFGLLYAGVWVTGSNGPVIVGAIVVLVCVFPPIAHVVLDYRASLFVIFGGLAVFITLGALTLWSPQIRGTTTTEVSNGYRGALYNLLPQLLSEHPFGYGPRGLPPNTYFAYTTTGTVDIARSIDSEFAYASAQFGLLAMIAFVAIAVLAALACFRHQALGLSSLSLTMTGLFLAIHTWNSLGTFWAFSIGSCVAVVFGGGDETMWSGLSNGGRWRRPAGETVLWLDDVSAATRRGPASRDEPMVLTPRRTGTPNDGA